jgi:hypothetical protein
VSTPYAIYLEPAVVKFLSQLPPQRQTAVRERVLRRLEALAQLAALRRFGADTEAEHLHLRVGHHEVQYTLEHAARQLRVRELQYLPSGRWGAST